jgi:hypothetical protein
MRHEYNFFHTFHETGKKYQIDLLYICAHQQKRTYITSQIGFNLFIGELTRTVSNLTE